MVRRVTFYTTVVGSSEAEVCNKVNEEIQKGYEPLGGITYGKDYSEDLWVQALVRYE